VAKETVPNEVKTFIAEQVRSLRALELLLLLRDSTERDWSAAELTKELRAGPDWTEWEVKALVRRGLIVQDQSDPPRYRYAVRRPDWDAALTWLQAAYPERRFTIIQLIYSAPSESLQSFAEAFKLRKDPDD
jgi:hypothetical protein